MKNKLYRLTRLHLLILFLTIYIHTYCQSDTLTSIKIGINDTFPNNYGRDSLIFLKSRVFFIYNQYFSCFNLQDSRELLKYLKTFDYLREENKLLKEKISKLEMLYSNEKAYSDKIKIDLENTLKTNSQLHDENLKLKYKNRYLKLTIGILAVTDIVLLYLLVK
ncbi:MAG: hypothetical protein KatS3mg096_622 [Candidatus Parcubacteria bacterium]|nr:MAG: hypothetical protein KatS3mg096_622 [Candidatus Parcubacteria bacterium]